MSLEKTTIDENKRLMVEKHDAPASDISKTKGVLIEWDGLGTTGEP